MAGLVLSVDPDGVLSGALKAKSALDTVVESARKTEAALKKAGDGGDALKRKFDPAYASALKLGNELDDLDRALKTGVIDAKVYANEIGRMGQAAARFGAISGQARGQIQQVGYQVGDFAVQVGAGTSAAQALGQQLPQLLGAFGPLGAVLGVVAAIGVPLGAALFGMAAGADALGDAIENASTHLDAFSAAVDNASLSADEMTAKYGAAADAVNRAFDAIALQKAVAAKQAVDDVSAAIAGMFSNGALGAADLFDVGNIRGFISGEAQALTFEFRAQQEALAGAEGNLDAQLSILTDMLATTQNLAAANGEVSAAEAALIYNIGEAINRTAEQIGLTNELGAATGTWGGLVAAASDYMASVVANAPVGGWLSGAIGDASALASELWDAAKAAAAARGGSYVNANTSKGPAFEDGGRSGSALPPALKVAPTLDDVIAKYAPRGSSGSRGGSGGGSGGGRGGVSAAEKAANDYKRLIETLDPATRSANDFADAQKTINDALKIGSISAAEAARAMGLAKDKYTEGGEAAKFWKGINSDLKESFLDMAVDGVNSFEDIARSIKRAALEALLFKSGPLAGLFGGGGAKAGGGFLGKIFGGGGGKGLFAGLFDGGGTISNGQFGIVGEKGPEIVRSTNSGAVVTSRANTARQLSGGGGTDVRVHVTTSIDNEGGIRNYVQTMAVQASQSAVNQVKGSLAGWSNQLGSDGVLT